MARRSPRTAGSIRKLASGRYQARWWDDARRGRVPAPTTFETRSDASRWLAQKESGLFDEPDAEKELAPVVPTLRSYADDWMATRTLRPGTQALYRSQLGRHLCPTFGETRLDGITPADVRRGYMDRLGRSSPQAAMRSQHVALERNERIARAIDDLLDADDEDQGNQTEAAGS